MTPDGLDLVLPTTWWDSLPGLLFGAFPLIASVAIAARKGGPIWLAALVAWIFGWFGLLLVGLYYCLPRSTERVPDADDEMETDPSDGSVVRLRTLNKLVGEGLITYEEYERKRLEVLERL